MVVVTSPVNFNAITGELKLWNSTSGTSVSAIVPEPQKDYSSGYMHIGGSTKEAQNRISIELAEKVIEFFKK
mgnify:CR=1 FL=1